MKGYLILDKEQLGEITFKVIDENMGVIGGVLIPYPAYNKYKEKIQSLYDLNGIANSSDLNFVISFDGNIINPSGGIGVIDSKEFDGIYVESAGIDFDLIKSFF